MPIGLTHLGSGNLGRPPGVLQWAVISVVETPQGDRRTRGDGTAASNLSFSLLNQLEPLAWLLRCADAMHASWEPFSHSNPSNSRPGLALILKVSSLRTHLIIYRSLLPEKSNAGRCYLLGLWYNLFQKCNHDFLV